MSSGDLAARLQRLEDIEAIKGLKARYCAHVDIRDEDAWVSLFTPDAVWDGGEFGRYEGEAAIRQFFRSIPGLLNFALHYVTNSFVEVDGDRATGHWYLLEPCTFADGNQAVWGAARYEEQYVRVQGEWKFKQIRLISWMWTPYDQGWAKRRFVGEEGR